MFNAKITFSALKVFSVIFFKIYFAECSNFADLSADPLKSWNLPDASAFPNKAFIYNLPSNYDFYEVTELELGFLPSWLVYDKDNQRLVGVAEELDVGKLYFIEVKAEGENGEIQVDVFKVEVEEEEKLFVIHHAESLRPPGGIHCKRNKAITSTSIILHLNHALATPIHKVHIIENFSKHYNLPLYSLSIQQYNNNDKRSSILVAGPGDYKSTPTSQKIDNALIRWVVGCGAVHKKQLAVLQMVENEAKEGVLGSVVGCPVVGWFVTNDKVLQFDLRRKRYLDNNNFYSTSTATVSLTPPDDSSTLQPISFPTPSFHAVKALNTINVKVGEVFDKRVGKDWFSHPPHTMQLLTIGGERLSSSSWLKLTSLSASSPASKQYRYQNRHLYGMPLFSHQGHQRYVLEATDQHGQKAQLEMAFDVRPINTSRSLFVVTFIISNLEYQQFVDNVDVRLNVSRRIAEGVGDRKAHDVLLVGLSKGVELSWTNKSMFEDTFKRRGCSPWTLRSIFDHIINASNGHLEDSMDLSMAPYLIDYASITTSGDCSRYAKGRFAHVIRGGVVTTRTIATDEPEVMLVEGGRSLDELLKQILVPTLLVVALVLLAFMIACLALNNSKKIKGEDEQLRKGTPVIFAHELEEYVPKKPLINHPSPKPPNYQQHMSLKNSH